MIFALIKHVWATRIVAAARGRAARIRRNACGAISMQFALLLFPVLLLSGGSIDTAIILISRSRAMDAADAASIAAANVAQAYLATNGWGSSQQATAKTLATTAMTNMFQANFKSPFGIANATPTMTMSVSSVGVTVVVTPSFNVTPAFLGLAGVTTIPVSVSSTSTAGGLQTYFQIIFVVDASGSMSIGGTTSDITALQSNTYIQCAFACHDPNDYQNLQITTYCQSSPNDWFCQQNAGAYCPWWTCTWIPSPYADKRAVARNYGIKLKIDYVNAAIADFMTQLSPSMTTYPNDFAIGIDTVGTSFNVKLAPTTIMSQINTAVAAVDVDPVVPIAFNYGYSYLANGLQSALSSLTNIGDGSAPNSRKTYLIFLSDGVEDVPGSVIYGRGADVAYATPTLNSACQAIKNAGVNVITVLAPYPVVANDTQYLTLVAPMYSQVTPAMQTCASSQSDFFLATDGPGIQTAVKSAFTNIFGNSSLRIAQ